MEGPPKFSAVTGFYNVRRDTVDGRGIDKYLGWLNRTVQLPLPFTVFLDPAIDPALVVIKPGDKVVSLPKSELHSYSWLPRVEEICRTSTKIKTRRDIAFHLPEYGVVVMSKIFMLQKAARLNPGDEALIWLDAGLPQFFADGFPAATTLDTDFLQSLAGAALAVQITPLLERALGRHDDGRHFVSTCNRLVSAPDILVSTRSIDAIADAVTKMVETEWLPNDLWDNEQVALGCLILRGLPEMKIVEVSMKFACVAERLFGFPARAPHKHSSIIQRLRWHFGKRAPLGGDGKQAAS
jgi:hypothetical protein